MAFTYVKWPQYLSFIYIIHTFRSIIKHRDVLETLCTYMHSSTQYIDTNTFSIKEIITIYIIRHELLNNILRQTIDTLLLKMQHNLKLNKFYQITND